MNNCRLYVSAALAATAICFAALATEAGCGTPLKERMHFNVGAGWGKYDLKRGIVKNGYSGYYFFDKFENLRVEGGTEYYGEILFDYSKDLSFGPGIIYSGGSRKILEDVQVFLDDYNSRPPQQLLYGTSFTAPYLKIRYRSMLDVLHYSVDGGLFYGFATLDAQMRDIYRFPSIYFRRVEFSSSGIGYSLSLGFSFPLTAGFAIRTDTGYRRMVVRHLKDPDGIELDGYDLDMSGAFIRGGISINPWR